MISLAEFVQQQGEGGPQDIPRLMRVLNDRQVLNVAQQEARLDRCAAHPRNAALPLRDEGEDYGRVEARVPATMFFQLMQQKNFGYEGFTSDEGMRDLLRDFPQCRVKTVSGNVVGVGFGAGTRRVVKRYGEI